MICFDCKEKHERRKPPKGGATTCQLTECDYCGKRRMCYPDYKVLFEKGKKMSLTKKDLPGLKELNAKTRTFIDDIFDWVSPLDRNSLLSEMYDFKGQLEQTIENLENDYWTYEDEDGEVFDGQFESRQEAYEYAEQKLADRCCDDGDMSNGETREEEIVLIHFKYDDDGEMIELEREDDTIEYEHYHGDLAEHGVWHSGGGGVL